MFHGSLVRFLRGRPAPKIKNTLIAKTPWYGLSMHFCDSNHEVTRMQHEENNNVKDHELISC